MCLTLVFTGSSFRPSLFPLPTIKPSSFYVHLTTKWSLPAITSSLRLVDNSEHSQPDPLQCQEQQILPHPLKQRRKINQPPDTATCLAAESRVTRRLPDSGGYYYCCLLITIPKGAWG